MQKLRSLINFDVAFFIFAIYLIIKGFLKRADSYLTAETGLGYMLGIVGASMMLLLLLYPLRKYNRYMKKLGSVKYWFRMHMLLGVAGPVLILYHSNFGLGSTNSNIALFCMLIVAGSGVLGRLFYIKIHDGLYGRKIELGELKTVLHELKQDIKSADEIAEILNTYEQRVLKHRNLLNALIFMPYVHLVSVITRKRTLKKIKTLVQGKEDVALVRKLHTQLAQYFKLLKRVADFSIYERLFSLWHVLHIPLFIMMVISGIIHVFAVHIY